MAASKGTSKQKRVQLLLSFSESIDDQDWTEALRLARAIALAGLPKRPTKKRSLTRTLRLGRQLWLRVFYAATDEDQQLPYGADRFVLAGIQHLALEANSPVVHIEEAGKLLKMFDLPVSGTELRHLRKRFLRLAGLSIRLCFGSSLEELDEKGEAEQAFIIERWKLPSRADKNAVALDDYRRFRFVNPASERESPYGVVLSDYFWKTLKDTHEQLLVPFELTRLFVDKPTGWDYLMFLVYRCSRARTRSLVDHEVLMELFKDQPDEPDRKVIARLQRYHEEIMTATGGRLKATLKHIGFFKKQGRGRKQKRWALVVQPSQSIIQSGRR